MKFFQDLVFVKPHPSRVPAGVERRVVTPRVCPGWRRRVAKRSRNAKNRRIPSEMLTLLEFLDLPPTAEPRVKVPEKTIPRPKKCFFIMYGVGICYVHVVTNTKNVSGASLGRSKKSTSEPVQNPASAPKYRQIPSFW